MARLIVRNANSFIQIDSNYKNMELLYKATATLSNSDALGYYAEVGMPANKSNVLMAIRDTTGLGCHIVVVNGNTWRIYGDRNSQNRQVTYYLFCEQTDDALPKVPKVVIRNPNNGKVIFTSTKRYLKVLHLYQGELQDDQSYSFDGGGRTLAVIQCMKPSFERLETGGTGSQPVFNITIKRGLMRIAGNVATVQNRFCSAFSSIGGGTNSSITISPAMYIFIDVTGY